MFEVDGTYGIGGVSSSTSLESHMERPGGVDSCRRSNLALSHLTTPGDCSPIHNVRYLRHIYSSLPVLGCPRSIPNNNSIIPLRTLDVDIPRHGPLPSPAVGARDITRSLFLNEPASSVWARPAMVGSIHSSAPASSAIQCSADERIKLLYDSFTRPMEFPTIFSFVSLYVVNFPWFAFVWSYGVAVSAVFNRLIQLLYSGFNYVCTTEIIVRNLLTKSLGMRHLAR